MANEAELSGLLADAQVALGEMLETSVTFHKVVKDGLSQDIPPVFQEKYQAERAWERARDRYITAATGVRLDVAGRGA